MFINIFFSKLIFIISKRLGVYPYGEKVGWCFFLIFIYLFIYLFSIDLQYIIEIEID